MPFELVLQTILLFPANSRDPFSHIFSLNTPHQSLSETQTNILREISALRATLLPISLERDWCETQTNILRESSALRPTLLPTSIERDWCEAQTNILRESSALRPTLLPTSLERDWCEAQTNILREISALRATLLPTSLERDWCETQTNILRESSALRSTLLRTSPSPRHKQIYSARAQRSAPRYSAPVPLRGTNKYTPRELSAPPHATPHQSLSEAQTNILRESSALRATLLPTSLERDWCEAQTNILREISALRAALLPTSLERDWCETQTNILRESSALRCMRGPCSEHFPSNEGEKTPFDLQTDRNCRALKVEAAARASNLVVQITQRKGNENKFCQLSLVLSLPCLDVSSNQVAKQLELKSR